jgi:hypothetical protein
MTKPKYLSDLEAIGIKMHNDEFPVYKYTSAKTAKLILENCSIRFSVPAAFNDPFEFCLDLFDFEISEKQFLEKLEKDLKTHTSFTPNERTQIIKKTSIDNYRLIYRNIINEQREQSLVFCTSEKNDNILMWSHYANFHQGVCIGLYMPSLIEHLNFLTMKVNYTDVMHPKSFFGQTDDETKVAVMNWIFTKSSCWSYEQEVRSLITNENDYLNVSSTGYKDVSLLPSQVMEVYFGMRTPEVDMKDIESIIKRKGYVINRFGKMEAEKGKYSLKVSDL